MARCAAPSPSVAVLGGVALGLALAVGLYTLALVDRATFHTSHPVIRGLVAGLLATSVPATALGVGLVFAPADRGAADGRELSVRLLEELGAELLAKNAPSAEEAKSCDLAALDSFLRLARVGLKDSTDGVLEWARDMPRLLDHLRYVLHRPPVELYLHGSNAAKMNLALLARAVEPVELDRLVRIDLLHLWHEQHGVYAAVADSAAGSARFSSGAAASGSASFASAPPSAPPPSLAAMASPSPSRISGMVGRRRCSSLEKMTSPS